MTNVLILEEDTSLASFLVNELKREGFHVEASHDGRSGLDLALKQKKKWDLLILDIELPELNGLEVCRRVRLDSHVPIIIISERDSIIDLVSGLDHGADDYITKPFAIEELLARIRALFRRIEFENESYHMKIKTTRFKDLIIEKENRLVRRGSQIIDLTKREYELLVNLIENANMVQSRSDLLKNVWEFDEDVETNVVDVYIRYLRNKIDLPNQESYIQTVRGKGYVMRD